MWLFRRRIALVLLAVGLGVPVALIANAGSPPPTVVHPGVGRTEVLSMRVDGVARSYRLYIPDRLPTGARPVLMVLHPLHVPAERFETRTDLDAGAARAGAYVVYPAGIADSWDAGSCCGVAAATQVDDMSFLTDVLADLERRFDIDRHRIALAGFSNGALMAYRFACARSDLVHVIAVVAGGILGPDCEATTPVTVLDVHGLRDNVIPFTGVSRSPLDRSGFPSAVSSVARVALADRCTRAHTSVWANGTKMTSTGCADGATVALVTSRTMGHTWPTGAIARREYGLDMTSMTWSFVRAAWAGPAGGTTD